MFAGEKLNQKQKKERRGRSGGREGLNNCVNFLFLPHFDFCSTAMAEVGVNSADGTNHPCDLFNFFFFNKWKNSLCAVVVRLNIGMLFSMQQRCL